jgi:hypothetical protein
LTGFDEAVAMSLRERGYVKVDDVNVIDSKSVPTASWMEDDGLHFMAPGPAPTPELMDDEMVKELGEEKAEQLLSQCRAQERH